MPIAPSTGATDWQAIALLYEGLVALAPTIGALVGRAAAVAEARDAETGLALLDRIAGGKDCHLSALLGADGASAGSFAAAPTRRPRRMSGRSGFAQDDAMRAFLIGRAARIRAN